MARYRERVVLDAPSARLPQLRSVNAIEMTFEQLFGSAVAKNLSRKSVDAIGKKADLIGGIIGNALAFGNKTTQHTVMTLI